MHDMKRKLFFRFDSHIKLRIKLFILFTYYYTILQYICVIKSDRLSRNRDINVSNDMF